MLSEEPRPEVIEATTQLSMKNGKEVGDAIAHREKALFYPKTLTYKLKEESIYELQRREKGM